MLVVDPRSPEPPFAQLHRQVAEQVVRGELRPGDRLPTVRRLAGDLGIAPNTVARAYRELEADGLIEGRGRAGTFVSRPHAVGADGATGADGTERAELRDEALAAARLAAESYAREVRALGVSNADALVLVRGALRT